MNIVKIFAVAVMIMAGNMLVVQGQPYSLTIEQARDYAIQHNKQLLNARDQTTSSQQKVKETVAQGLPQIDGSLSYMTYFNYGMELSFGSSGSEPTINYALLDAGDMEIMKSLSSMFGSSEPIVMTDQLNGKVQLSQLIFSGQYLAGIQMARIARKMADQNLVVSELDVKTNVTNTYFGILTTEKTLEILSENLVNLNDLLKHTNNLYQAGVAEETDVDQLKITVSQMKNTQKALERMNQLNYNMLKFQLGVAPDVEIVLTDSLGKFLEPYAGILPAAGEFDIVNNPSYQLMETQVSLTKKQVDMQKWAYAPTVAGYYNYTQKILTTGFDMTPNHLAGVTLSVPIFSSGIRRAQLAQSNISLDIAQRNLEIIKDQLETQKKQLLFNYQNALENFITQRENIDVAARVYKSIQNKYQQGVTSSLNLTQANSNLLSAQSNYTSAVLTLLQAKTALDKLYNKL